jgi:uncharacterized protein Smg (DUF494 family)
MKDRIIEMLMHLFEKGLDQLKKEQALSDNSRESSLTEPLATMEAKAVILKAPKETAIRVFTYAEQMKLTKASYQFLMRLSKLGIIAPEAMELVLHHLMLSESRLVSLNETKWTLRSILGDGLSHDQLAFLDLVLYQKEDNLAIH